MAGKQSLTATSTLQDISRYQYVRIHLPVSCKQCAVPHDSCPGSTSRKLLSWQVGHLQVPHSRISWADEQHRTNRDLLSDATIFMSARSVNSESPRSQLRGPQQFAWNVNAAIASKGFRRHRWTRKIKKANLPNLRFPAFSFQDQQSASMTRCEQAPNLPSLQGPKMAKADGSPQTCAVKKLRQPRAREQAQSALSEKDNLKPTPEPHVNIANIRLQRQTYKLNQINPTYIPVKCMIDTSTNLKYEPKMTPLLHPFHPARHRYFVHHAKSLLHTWKILEATQWHQDASNLMSTCKYVKGTANWWLWYVVIVCSCLCKGLQNQSTSCVQPCSSCQAHLGALVWAVCAMCVAKNQVHESWQLARVCTPTHRALSCDTTR